MAPAQAASLAALTKVALQQSGWMDEVRRGEILTVSQAATICDLTPQATRDRCQQAEDEGTPIAVRIAGVWLISRQRLLEDIELRSGRHERLVAEERAKKASKLGSAQVLRAKSDQNLVLRK